MLSLFPHASVLFAHGRSDMALVTEAGNYDRRGVMREAHRLYRVRRGCDGWTFSLALRHAWGRARAARAQRQKELTAFQQPMSWAA